MADADLDGVDVVVATSGDTVCDVLRQEARELKWAVLAVACFLTFGSYYIYDFPGSIGTGSGNTIEQHFRRQGKVYSQAQNQALYSVYSWPNTVLAMFGGLLIDRFLGLRRGMLLFTALILSGSVLFFFGVRITSYPLMLCGRVVFGLGGESLSVSQSAFVARWFKSGRGMALAFGITLSFCRVGSSFNFIFSPIIANRWGVVVATLAGVGACLVSLMSCLVLICADMYAVRTGYIQPEAADAGTGGGEEDADADQRMRISDIFKLPVTYWLLCVICVACYTAIFPFIGIGKNFFEVKYGYSGDTAAKYVSSYQLTSAAVSPIIGLLVDAVGRNSWWLVVASTSFVAVHCVFVFTMIPPLPIMVSMGCFYSFLASGLWPSIPWAVTDNIVAFSYGVMTAIQNIGLATAPILIGAILDRHTPSPDDSSSSSGAPPADDSASSSSSSSSWQPSPPTSLFASPSLEGYVQAEYVFMGAAAVSLVASIALVVCDMRRDGILSTSSTKRRLMLASRAEQRGLLAEDAADDEDAME